MSNFLSLQEIFTTVKNHLLAQNARAFTKHGSNVCAYRSPDGLKCAAGCLIKDEYYRPTLETHLADHYFVRDALVASGVNMNDLNVRNLVVELQEIHDGVGPLYWPRELRDLAERFSLEY